MEIVIFPPMDRGGSVPSDKVPDAADFSLRFSRPSGYGNGNFQKTVPLAIRRIDEKARRGIGAGDDRALAVHRHAPFANELHGQRIGAVLAASTRAASVSASSPGSTGTAAWTIIGP